MPPFLSASKAVAAAILLRKNGRFGAWIGPAKCSRLLPHFNGIRCLSSIAGMESPSTSSLVGPLRDCNFPFGSFCSGNFVQRRRFLGCGDGEEGDGLAKVYEERRVLGYSPEQLFDVVAAVDLYEGFLPWCQRSEIIRRHSEGSFEAELEIGFKFLVESYISHVELTRPKYIKTTVSDSSLFDHLINVWNFKPGPVPGSCSLYFLVDFKFQSPFYRQVSTMFFKEVVSRLVSSFSDRCRLIYGPEVPVLEGSHGQSF